MSKQRETVDIYGYFCPWRGIILKKRGTILYFVKWANA